jgi:hypothetical protein
MAAVAAALETDSSAPTMQHDGVLPASLGTLSRPAPEGCRARG